MTEQIVRVILINKEKKILLVKHKWKTNWVFPGWHIEEWENMYKALKREIKEELWVNIKLIWEKNWLINDWIKEMALPIAIYKIKYTSSEWKEKKRLEYIFLANIKETIIRTQIDEIDEYNFFTKWEICILTDTYKQIREVVKFLN